MLERLARACVRRRRIVVVAWIVAVVGFNALSSTAGGDYSSDFEIPGSEAQEAFDLLSERFPGQNVGAMQIAFQAAGDPTAPEFRAPLEHLFADVAALPGITGVDSPFDGTGQAQISPLGNGIGFANVRVEGDNPNAIPAKTISTSLDLIEQVNSDTLQVEAGGPLIQFRTQSGPSSKESLGLLAAVFILLFAFGSVIAMGLPIITAILALGCGLAVLGLFANFASVPDFTPQLATMVGLGVGIDYALFIVTRFRQSLHAGMDAEDAIALSMVTSGRAVIFAGLTVVISLLGLLLIGLDFMNGVALGAAATVLFTVFASITFLPALLGFVGRTIDSLKLPGRDLEPSIRESRWYRWSRFIQRWPWITAMGSFLVLAVIAVPVFSMRLGTSDTGNDSPDRTTRRAYDLLAEGFGPGFNGPLLIVVDVEPGTDVTAAATTVADSIQAVAPPEREGLIPVGGPTRGVVFVAPPQVNEAGDTAMIVAFPAGSPQSEDTERVVRDLRAELPSIGEAAGATVRVSGLTAMFQDMSDFMGRRLPVFIGGVIALSFVLLMVVFRSLLVPVKAAVMNLLGIGAAYGVIVAVFQWGWGADLLGIGRTGPIEQFVPMMMFAILFGLSMDYEVFLLSRMREEYLRSGDNAVAVADGLAATARVITAAAAIMVTLFGAFFLGDERVLKMFGLGLGVAVLLDATIVRMVLVPSTMELMGRANWWLPAWLDRLIPDVSVESGNELVDQLIDREVVELTGHHVVSGDGNGDGDGDGHRPRPVTAASEQQSRQD